MILNIHPAEVDVSYVCLAREVFVPPGLYQIAPSETTAMHVL